VGDGEGLRQDRTREPFGEGSPHTTTARWVTAELLPQVKWFDRGRVCEGVGMAAPEPAVKEAGAEEASTSAS